MKDGFEGEGKKRKRAESDAVWIEGKCREMCGRFVSDLSDVKITKL